MNLYKSRYNTQKQLLTQCELRFGELEEKVAKDKVSGSHCLLCRLVPSSSAAALFLHSCATCGVSLAPKWTSLAHVSWRL